MAMVTGQHTGRGKPLNIEYNLIPFIDLLSCCIAFLLMTAVWTQISMIQTNEGTSESIQTKEDITLALYIYKDRLDLSAGEGRVVPIAKIGPEYNLPRLSQELFTVKKSHPNKRDILILAQDKVLYKELVATMDRCIDADFPNITVSGMVE